MAAKKEITSSKWHCNIDEHAFSKAMFLCRFFVGIALIYLALGSLLYWREFLVNAVWVNLPWAVWTTFLLAGAELFLGLFLLLGWYTRICAGAALIVALLCAVIFFAGAYNHVFVAVCLLLCAPLSVLMWLGPGAFSLDLKRRQRAIRKLFRGKL